VLVKIAHGIRTERQGDPVWGQDRQCEQFCSLLVHGIC
jgi:hypothetical protein